MSFISAVKAQTHVTLPSVRRNGEGTIGTSVSRRDKEIGRIKKKKREKLVGLSLWAMIRRIAAQPKPIKVNCELVKFKPGTLLETQGDEAGLRGITQGALAA